jgi:3-hydroxyisobutyrate dehydrogenase-like beta-hydroxyacid dehydrogenase
MGGEVRGSAPRTAKSTTTVPARSIRTVAVVGCGRMGAAIGGHLLRAGHRVVAVDPDPAARERLVSAGARPAGGAAEAAGEADLLLVVVVDDEQVQEALSGEGGALATARPGTVVAICASVRPDTCRSLAAAGAERGVHVIDVALVRGERGAEEGRLALMCGGPAEVIDACRPAFAAFAADVHVLGEVGAGQVAKTANNILLWACLRAGVEAQRLARALGVEPAVLREALAAGSGANRPLAEWGMHRLRWPAKDLEVARALAAEAGVEAPLVEALGPLMDELTVDDLRDLA